MKHLHRPRRTCPGPVLVTVDLDDTVTLRRIAVRPGGICADCSGTGTLTIPHDDTTPDLDNAPDVDLVDCPFCAGTGDEPAHVSTAIPLGADLPTGWRWATTDDITEESIWYGAAS